MERASRVAEPEQVPPGLAWRLTLTLVVLAGVILTGYAWIVSSPIGGSPDDDFHIGSIWCPTPIADHCETQDFEGEVAAVVPPGVWAAACYAFNPDQSAACIWTALSDTSAISIRIDDGFYPGGYYDVMHLFAGDDANWDVMVIRWVNWGLTVLVIGALCLLSTPSSRRLLVYTAVATSVPLVIYFQTSINPTSWAILGVSATWFGLANATTVASRRRAIGFAVATIVAAAMAASARADAGAFLCLVAAAMTFLHWPDLKQHKPRLAVPAAVAVFGLAGFLSGSQTDALGGLQEGGTRNPLAVLVHNLIYFPQFVEGFWSGPLGWLDIPIVPFSAFVPMMTVFALVIWGLRRSSPRQRIALAAIGAAIVALPLYILQQSLMIVGEGVQPRYLAPLMVVFVGLALSQQGRPETPALGLWPTLLMYLGLAGAHSLALFQVIRRYVTGIDVQTFNLDAAIEWWRAAGPSPMATWFLGSLGFALLATVLFAVRRPDTAIPEAD